MKDGKEEPWNYKREDILCRKTDGQCCHVKNKVLQLSKNVESCNCNLFVCFEHASGAVLFYVVKKTTVGGYVINVHKKELMRSNQSLTVILFVRTLNDAPH